jgi:autotransporter-associated beta strand protein
MVAAAIFAVGVTTPPQARAANIYWDTNGSNAGTGGTGSWDTTSPFWSPTSEGTAPGAIDNFSSQSYTAFFTGTAGTATLAGPITIGGLVFSGADFTIAGDILTLDASVGTPSISVSTANVATISSLLAGVEGLVKTGGGSLRLGNAANSLTGALTIEGGSIIVSSATALGGTGAIRITSGNVTPSNTNLAYQGGALVLDGTAGGFVFSRDINFEGRGPLGDRASAILSVGDNTLSGVITSASSLQSPVTSRNSRINSVNGTLTISGTFNVGGSASLAFTSLGGVNTVGVGNFSFAGATLAGTGSLEKSGSGVLYLDTAASVSGFTGTVRVGASSVGQQSTIRVTKLTVGSTSVFGASTASGTTAPININGGVLEFRSNSSLNFNSLTAGKNVYFQTTAAVFTGPAAGGAAINGVTTLGLFRVGQGQALTLNSRNGYGMAFQAWTMESSNGNTTITNEMGGLLTFAADIWNNTDNTGNRTLTIGGAGNTRVTGNLIASAAAFNHILSKGNAGLLTILGVGGTLDGATNVQGGSLQITDFRSIGNNTAAIVLGNATATPGNLIIGTSAAAAAVGLTTSKTISLSTTTANNSIYASQDGANPVILNGAITRIAATTTGALILGGTSTVDNIINVAIPGGGTVAGGVTKLGAGTWVLNAANTYIGATTIHNGTLKLRATAGASDVVASTGTNTVVFSADTVTQTAGGNLEFRGFLNTATTETLGALTPTAGAATITLLGNGTGKADLGFTSLGATTAASSVNFVTTGANGGVVTLTGQPATTATNLPGTANFLGRLYINGADFATINASAQVVAPTYGASGNFLDASTDLVSAVHNKLTASFTNAATTAVTVSSLLTNSQTLTLSGDLIVTTGGILQSGGTATIRSNSSSDRIIRGPAVGLNLAIRVDQASDVLNLGTASEPVIFTAAGTTAGVTKNGAGTLVLFGGNLQTGAFNINEGVVRISGASARIGGGPSITIRQGAKLELDGSANNNNSDLIGAGTLTNINAAAVTFQTNGSGVWSGLITQDPGAGALSVFKGGTTGAPNWTGQNTYTGSTTIGGSTGSITVDFLADGGVASGIGASTADAANLVFNSTGLAGLIYRGNSYNGSLIHGSNSASTDRLFTLSAASASIQSIVNNNNALVWSNTGAIVHGSVAARTLTLSGTSTGDNTFNPQLTDSGIGPNVTSLTKSGAGQWNLGNSNNTFMGTTTVSEGILALNQSGALPANSPLVLGSTATSGILQASGTFTRNLAASAVVGTGTITWGGTAGGGGFAAHATPLTVTLDGGAGLTWGSGGFVGTGGTQALIFNSASALADVTFTNAIDLGNTARNITVNDNGQTGADYASLTGVLSGAGGGLFKAGSGVLRLGSANTYTGTTSVDAGTLVVSSLGSSTVGSPGATSVGAGAVTMDNANAIDLGNATTTGGNLQYVGAGETSNRKIRLRGTTANSGIYADGSGPLILTNVAHDTTETGAKTLNLRGSNTDGNRIDSPLSNNGAGALSVTVDGGATWILTNASNNYTGATTVSAGALGIGGDTVLGAGTLTLGSGSIFAYGGDRVISNPITHSNNSNVVFIGDYSLSFSSVLTLAASSNNANLTANHLAAGKSLTFGGGVAANSLGADRAWAFEGGGETVINGNFTTTTGRWLRLDINAGGQLTLGTSGAGSNFNQGTTTAIDVDRGTLKFTANNAIPTPFTALSAPTTAGTAASGTTYTVASTAALLVGQPFTGTNVAAGSRILSIDSPTTFTSTVAVGTTAVASGATLSFLGSGGLLLSPELATGDTALVDLNGTTQTITSFTATTDGTSRIDNTAAAAAVFRFGAGNSAVSFSGNHQVLNTGAGALSLVKLGSGAASFGSGVSLANRGEIATEGGALAIAGAVSAVTALRAVGASTLSLTGALANPQLITSVEVGAGSTLGLLNGAGSQFTGLSVLRLGNSVGDTGSGVVTLNLNIGDGVSPGDGLGTDTLSLGAGGTLSLSNAQNIVFNLTDAGLNPNQTYTLLAVPSGGLDGFLANIVQGATPGGFASATWNESDTAISITMGNLITGRSWWNAGGALDNWSDVANWSITDKSGATAAVSTPGQGTDVVFVANNIVGGAAVSTTLEGNFKVNSIVFEASTAPADTPSAVTIAPGALAANRLEIAPQVSTDGVAITAGGPASVTVSSPFRIGAAQTWTVADAAGLLTLSGGLQGAADVTKTGAGRALISGAADVTFNTALTSDFTVAGGNLEMSVLGGLGTTVANNLARLNLTGGGFYYNNGTAGTVANPITLAGGALSGGGASHTYSGAIAVVSPSFVNMADSNGLPAATARSITLSGAVTGTANLTIDSNNTDSGGNQLGGMLSVSNAGGSWSGNLIFNRGTVSVEAAASATVQPMDITFNSFGRYIVKGADGQTINRAGILTLASAAVAEFQVDNTTGTQVTDFVVNQNGAINLGAGSALRVALADQLARLNLAGPVTLAGNASISLSNASTRILTVSGVIGETGGARSLAINDDQGGWGATNGIVRLTAANTFTGNLAVGDGVLEFVTVSNVGGAASNLGQGSAITMSGGTLRFAGAVSQTTDRPIATSGSATLSASGTSGAVITYAGAITQALDNNLALAGAAGAEGAVTGGITQSGVAADLNVTSGIWTLSGAASVLADDIVVTGATAVLNLNGASLISFTAGTSNGLYARTGAVINLLSSDVFGPLNAGSLDFILLGDNSVGGGLLNLNAFNIETPRFDLGQRNIGYEGQVDGTGTVFVRGGLIDLFRGTVNANLASDGSTELEKYSMGTVSLRGDNSGLASTGATIVYAGSLVLDYSANTATKLRTASALDMRGGALTLNGNASSGVAQTVASLTLGSGGSNFITLSPAAGNGLALNLNALTRAINAQDGTLRIVLPSGTQSAANGVTTDTTNGLGSGAAAILGGWLTVDDGSGVFFARNATNAADGNIVAAVTTERDAISTWVAGENISDASGFTGTLTAAAPVSLRFNAAAGSDLVLAPTGALGVVSGGVLVTANVGGSPSIANGTLFSGALAANVPELIFIQDSAQAFEVSADILVNHSLTKSGNGVLLLSGQNRYSGVTEIQNGALRASGGNAIGDASLVNLSASRATTFQLLASETIGRLAGGSRQTDQDQGLVDVGAHTLTLNMTGGTTYSGMIAGSGSIVMTAASNSNFNYNGQSSTATFTGTVLVNGGLFQLSGATARLGGATAFTINNRGNFLFDNNDDAAPNDRVADTASFTVNSASGFWGGSTVVRGLAIRSDNNANESEAIGALTFASGASYASLESSGGSSAFTAIIADSWIRQNGATINIRGRVLGATADANGRTQFKVQDANDAALIAANIGGGGVIGGTAKNVSILPWAIGETVAGGMADANMGNTFASYVDNRGLVPLALANEYSTFAAAAAGHNVRESLTADLGSLASLTANSLIIHNNSTAASAVTVSGAGVGAALGLSSGALMFTLNSAATASTAHAVTLGGFDDGITAGSSGEYVIHVVNPSSAATTPVLTATIGSPLTSAADLTKSGRGTLILTGANTAGGGARRTTLNEGVLQIGDLDQIGGATGALVFAGGALRLGAGFADDLSGRTLSFLAGGGAIDTNGVDVGLAGSLGSGVGGFTKLGAGNLTLNASAAFTGGAVLSAGTVTANANNALGNGGPLSLGAGATLTLGAAVNLNHSLVTTSGASPDIAGTGTITAAQGFSFGHTGDITVAAVLAGPQGLSKSQSSVLTLSGLNTYAGTTEVTAGTLVIDNIANVGGGASALGAPTTAADGVIRMGFITNGAGLRYTGAGHSSDRIIGLQGTTGTISIFSSGTGALALPSGARFEMGGGKTLALRGDSAPGLENSIGMLTEAGGALTINKADANTWLLTVANAYTGATQVDNGTLKLGASGALPAASALRLGTGTTAGVLDLGAFSQTAGALLAQTNSTTATNQILIATGRTLTVTGAVTIGANVAAGATTLLTLTGGGSFVNNNDGGTFQVGGGTGGTNTSATTADFSGLASFSVNLGATGVFRVGDANSNSSGSPASSSTLKLSDTAASIIAGTLNLGQGTNQGAAVQTLSLGAGTNVIRSDIIHIGGNSTRSGGALVFSGPAGSVQIRGVDGTSAVTAVNMVNGAINTGIANTTSFLLAGHQADVRIGNMTMAAKSAGAGASAATLTFDQGSFEVATLLMTAGTDASSGVLSSQATFGGGAVAISSLSMGVNASSAAATVTAAITVSGGVVALGAGSGTAVNMGNAGAGRTVTSGITINAGTVDVSGNIVRTGGAGTENATITVNGGTLDLNGNTLGEASKTITFTTQAGTLRDVGTINGTAGLTKTGAGMLAMEGASSYVGATTVNAGKLTATSLGDGIAASALGTSALTPANLVFATGVTFGYAGSGETSARGFTLGDSLTLESAGTGALAFTSAAKVAFATTGATRTLTLTGAQTGANSFGVGLSDVATADADKFNLIVKDAVGAWVIANGETLKSTVQIDVNGGLLGLTGGVLPLAGRVDLATGTTLRFETGNTDDLSGRIRLDSGAAVTLAVASDVQFATSLTVDGVGGGAVTKSGAGKVTLTVANTAITGGFTVAQGTMDVTHAQALGAAAATVTGGLLTVNATIANTVNVSNGGTLGGGGILGTANVALGGTLAPGNSPGMLTVGNVVLAGGSFYEWQVQNATNHSTGYDKLTVTGNLDLTGATPGSRITIRIASLLGAGDGNTAGNPLNFSAPGVTDQLTFFQFGQVGGVLLNNGVSISDVFAFNVDGFRYSDGSTSNAGLWSIDWNQGNGAITLTAVPEPSTYGFGLGALALAAAAIRRRRKQKAA